MTRFICNECGKLLSWDDAIMNPDGDANCDDCWKNNKGHWFNDEEPDEPVEQEEIKPDKTLYDSGSVEKIGLLKRFGRR